MTSGPGRERGIRAGVRRLFRLPLRRRDIAHADADAELQAFVEERIDDLVRRGMSPLDARAEAIRRLGAPLPEVRESLRWSATRREVRLHLRDLVHDFNHDIRYAARGLARRPGFTAAAVLCLAIGIGANATMFGIVDALLLRQPPGIRDPRSLVWVAAERAPFGGFREIEGIAYPDFLNVRRSEALAGAAAYQEGDRSFGRGVAIQQVHALTVTHGFMPLLGVEPAMGRFFDADDDRPGARPVVVLGNALWRAQFAGERNVIGQTVRIGTRLFTIVGVTPPEFNGVERRRIDIYLPLAAGPSDFMDLYLPSSPGRSAFNSLLTGSSWLMVVARLKPGYDGQRLSAELQAVYNNANAGERFGPTKILVESPTAPGAMRSPQMRQNALISVWLAGVAAIVLLIACINVAGLLLTRAVRRRREIAVRVALGGGRSRLARMLLTESLLLAVAGGLGSLIVASVGAGLFRATLLSDIALPPSVLDTRVLAITFAATVLTAIVCGLAPAIRATRPDLVTTLKGADRVGPEGGRLLSGLLVGQVALTLVLLVGAGLFVRSVQNLSIMDLGFDAQHVIRVRASADFRGAGPRAGAQFFDRLTERLHHTQGVRGVALATGGPFSGTRSNPLTVPGHAEEKDRFTVAIAATPDFFATLGITRRSGRLFTDADRAGTERVAVVNEAMAHHYWPAGDAVGRCIKVGGDTMPCTTVIGIVKSARQGNHVQQPIQDEDPEAAYYIPYAQDAEIATDPFATPTLYVRTVGDASGLVSEVRALMVTLAPELTYPDVVAFSTALAPQFRPWKLGASLFGLFGGIALLLATVGLYGVLAFRVSQRTHEIGVRIALGARARDVERLVIRQGLVLSALGVTIGIGVALAAGGALSALLYGVSPTDPAVLALSAAVLVLAAGLASWLPALRAARVDPMEALRDL